MILDSTEILTLETGQFKLDGGAMFGTVPKVFWEKAIPPDILNRIPMALRVVLVKDLKNKRNCLIDVGIGHKGPDKFNQIYTVDYSNNTLEKNLKIHGLTFEDITDVVITHLHFDHVGGATTLNTKGEIIPTFSNAIYYLLEENFKWAKDPNLREKASYIAENFIPLKELNQLLLCKDAPDFEKKLNWPGFKAIATWGHTMGLLCPILKIQNKTFAFPSDLIPTASHLPLPWVTGYDMQVIKILEEKEKILKAAVSENWIIIYEHDPVISASTVMKSPKHYQMGEIINFS